MILSLSGIAWNRNEMISVKETVIKRSASLCDDKSGGIIGKRNLVVLAVNLYFSRDIDTTRTLDRRSIEAVVNFA